MKRIAAMLLCVALLLSLWSISLAEIKVSPGDTVSVTFTVSSNLDQAVIAVMQLSYVHRFVHLLSTDQVKNDRFIMGDGFTPIEEGASITLDFRIAKDAPVETYSILATLKEASDFNENSVKTFAMSSQTVILSKAAANNNAAMGIEWNEAERQFYLTINGQPVSWLIKHDDIQEEFRALGLELEEGTESYVHEDIRTDATLYFSNAPSSLKLTYAAGISKEYEIDRFEAIGASFDWENNTLHYGCLQELRLSFDRLDNTDENIQSSIALLQDLCAHLEAIYGKPDMEEIQWHETPNHIPIKEAVQTALSANSDYYINYYYDPSGTGAAALYSIQLTMYFSKNEHDHFIYMYICPKASTSIKQKNALEESVVGTVTNSSLTIRKNASISAGALAQLENGDTVNVIDSTYADGRNWYLVQSGAVTGYVLADHIRLQ